MANPQKENGFTPISNELLESIYRHSFTSTQLKIILCVCRYTYGYSRKVASLGAGYIAKAIGYNPRSTAREIVRLIKSGVLIEDKTYKLNSPRKLGLQKDYEVWRVDTHKGMACRYIGVWRADTQGYGATDTLTKAISKLHTASGETSNPINTFKVWWADSYRKRFGTAYLFSHGRDGKHIKSMLEVVDLSELQRRADTFLNIKGDSFLEKSGYTIPIFYSRFNSLVKQPVKKANAMDGLQWLS